MRTETSIEIDRPIRQVFELTNKHVAQWSIVVVEDEVIEDVNNGGVGTKFRVVTADRGKRMEFAGEVIEHRPPNSTRSKMIGQYFEIDVEYLFEDLRNERTRVTQKSTVNGKGIFFSVMMKLMGIFLNKSNCDSQRNELESLKAFVESS